MNLKRRKLAPPSKLHDASYLQARSFSCVAPDVRAQWTQQKICPSVSTPWPTIRQLQCGQTGASAWIAHSKLSKMCRSPRKTTSNALSYSFSQTSHLAIHNSFARDDVSGGVLFSVAGNIPSSRRQAH